jgi:hypothetical protein
MHAQALFLATLQSGNSLDRFKQSARVDLLESMTPETAEDYLCRGITIGTFKNTHNLDVKRTQPLADIDKAIELRDTPLARFFRAFQESAVATEGGDLPSFERALDHIRQAKLRLSDNKSVRLMSLHAHLWAANKYEGSSQPEKRKAVLEEAGRDAEELKEIHSIPYVMDRVNYFELIGDRETALAELDRASRHPETNDLVAQYALALYERNRDNLARQVLDERLKPENSAGQMLRIILYAEKVGPDKAYERYLEMARKRAADGGKASRYEIAGLMLLGRRKESADLADSIFNQPPGTSVSRSATKILESAGDDGIKLCFGHFGVGMEQLMDGDRAGAREHFQKVLDTKILSHNVYRYARAYLARLKHDPKWPAWVPVKK